MTTCTLCSIDLVDSPVLEGEKSFCCVGCHAVYKILSNQGMLDNYQESDLFKQALKSGIITNRLLLDQIADKKEIGEEICRLHLEIEEMWCPSCAQIIQWLLLREKGVVRCVIDYATDFASVEFDPKVISKDKIFQIINKLGYNPKTLEDSQNRPVSRSLLFRFAVAAFCSTNIMMLSYPIYASYFSEDVSVFVWLSFFCSLPVIFYSGWPIWKRFWPAIQSGIVGMETLILLGVGASFYLSVADMLNGGNKVYFDSMTVIIAFVLLGKMIESKAKFSAKESLFTLNKAVPKRGRLKNGQFIPVKEIKPGDELVVLMGEKIVLDGVVVEGSGGCDESLMTGEAIPIRKEVGSSVLGGCLLTQGNLVYRVTSSEKETALHRIITLIEQDIGSKSIYTRAVDPIVSWFVPVVVAIAAAAALISHDPLRGVAVLLISCPCAIGIAAPLAESKILSALASIGVIVRNRGVLPILGKETAFIFDKTGTITEGRFEVVEGLKKEDVLKGITNKSNHPISIAINRSIHCEPFEMRVEEIPGKGLIGNGIWRLGSSEFTGIKTQSDKTEVHLTENGKHITTLILEDTIKKEAPEVIQGLKSTTMLLSGDGEDVVRAVSKACNFDLCKWECSPLEKKNFVDQLKKQGEIVAMIGDGINDAPALTAAHIGMSVVNATDISIQVSDLLLTTSKIDVLLKIEKIAQFGSRILKQNLFWAFFYNCVGVALAVFGLLSPIYSAIAMVVSSLMVILNAERIR